MFIEFGLSKVMTKDELAAMKKKWMDEMKANMKNNEKVRHTHGHTQDNQKCKA